MEKFFQNIIRFVFVPFIFILIIVGVYLRADPYMDFGKKDDYSWTYNFQLLGDLSTKKLLNSNAKYNSFVFGSSRSVSLYACYLNTVVPNSFFFHYANWGEAIEGIKNKLELLDSLGYPIDNAVMYFDTDLTFKGKGKCGDTDHYLVTKQTRLEAILSHFKGFYKNISLDKVKILLGYNNIEGQPYWKSDPVTNDAKHPCNDQVLLNYSKVDRSDSLTAIIDSLIESGYMYERPLEQQYCRNQISGLEQKMLYRIKEILNKHSANYYVVITPLYDQKKFSLEDREILTETFGERLFDFSGINNFTENVYNFPDRMHFQPYISKCIIDSVFQPETSESGIGEILETE